METKIAEFLTYAVVVLFSINAVLTAVKTVCDKIVEQFDNPNAGKISAVVTKIAAILSKVLEFVSANTVKK